MIVIAKNKPSYLSNKPETLVPYKISIISLLSLALLQACSTTPGPTLLLEDVPTLYETPAINNKNLPLNQQELITENDASNTITGDACAAIAEEIEYIDTGLGNSAIDKPPDTAWPSGWKRTGSYIYNLFKHTILGLLQPVIQTKRAIFNNDEIERRASESIERGTTRRAYLIGYAEATGCKNPDTSSAGNIN